MWHTTRVGRSLAVMLRAFYGLLLVAIAHPRPSADHHYLRRRRRRAGKTGRSHRGGPMGEHLDYPTGVALDRAGNVFVGDSGNARVVRKVDRDTGVITASTLAESTTLSRVKRRSKNGLRCSSGFTPSRYQLGMHR